VFCPDGGNLVIRHHISEEWSPQDSCYLVFPMVLQGALSTCMHLSPLRSCTMAQAASWMSVGCEVSDVGFVIDKVTLGQAFLQVSCFTMPLSFHQCSILILHVSVTEAV
jgi:hypothetical protein